MNRHSHGCPFLPFLSLCINNFCSSPSPTLFHNCSSTQDRPAPRRLLLLGTSCHRLVVVSCTATSHNRVKCTKVVLSFWPNSIVSRSSSSFLAFLFCCFFFFCSLSCHSQLQAQGTATASLLPSSSEHFADQIRPEFPLPINYAFAAELVLWLVVPGVLNILIRAFGSPYIISPNTSVNFPWMKTRNRVWVTIFSDLEIKSQNQKTLDS